MKRLLFLVALFVATMAFAYEAEIDGIYYDFDHENKTATVTYDGDYDDDNGAGYTQSEIIIPEKVTYNGNEYIVTKIGDYAFLGCTGFTSVTIPNSVTEIGLYAFLGCTGLTSIEIPNGVNKIDGGAFFGCTGLTSVVWNAVACNIDYPAQIFCFTEYADDGGEFNEQINSFTFGDSVKYIPAWLCSNIINLTSIEIPNSVTAIGPAAFYGCKGLTSVVIPSSVTTIGEYLFWHCEGLKSVTIPNNVTSIGSSAFSGCTGLTTIEIPNNVTTIGERVFDGCTGLMSIDVDKDNQVYASVDGVLYNKNITTLIRCPEGKALIEIPNSVTSIGYQAFYGCTGLTTIEIPNNVTTIGEYLFWHCKGLKSVTIPNNVTSIGSSAFSGCTGLTSIVISNGVTAISSYAFSDCTRLTSITIPDGVKEIGNYAFQRCIGLISIEIPNSVTKIGDYTFSSCIGLISITIPDSVKEIGYRAFERCIGLTSIEIPNSVTKIGDYAFEGTPWFNNQPNGCVYIGKSLCAYKGEMSQGTHIKVKEGTIEICGGVFQGCTGLTSIEIPNSVTSIGYDAFYGCTELMSIEVDKDNQSYTSVDGVLYDKNKTTLICCPGGKTSVEIPNDVTNIGYAAFAGCTRLTTITIPNGVTLIDFYTFYGCTGLTSIEIPNSVTKIEMWAFYGCTGLTSIVIPNSVTRLDYQAFVGCIGLTSVTIGKGVYISDIEQLLNDCTGLMSINVVDKDNKYCAVDGVLYDKNITTLIRCPRGKTSVEIPNSVTEIGDRAFYGCTGLSSIEISNNVTTIGDHAFSGCTGLMSIDVDKDNQVYASVDGVLYNKDITKIIYWPAGKPSVEIPNSVTKIEDYAFYGCIGLTSIEIPNSVTEIGNYAFYGCTGLMSIDVDKDNQVYASVDGVLYNKNITTLIRCPEGKAFVEIPNSVTSIGDDAFVSCTGLTRIEIPNSVTQIGKSAFARCTGLTRFEIPNSVTSIGDYAFFKCIGLASIEMSNSVTEIGYGAFYDCESLTSITIPNSVTSIGSAAFNGCTGLISIEFKAQNPIIINQGPFSGVSRLIQIKVPCGSKARYQCTKVWNEFVYYEEVTEATLKVNVNDETMGFATIIKQNSCTDDAAQVQAQALSGYKFVRWSDGATENPHILLVTEDVTITAEFAPIGTETFVENLDGSTINIYSNNGVLYVDGLSVDYQVFDVNGRLVYSGCESVLSLPCGVYVVVVGDEVEKIVL